MTFDTETEEVPRLSFRRLLRVIMPLFPEAEELVYVWKYLLYKSY